ncbi:3,2-trans-enoyl-CoA isomerase [Grifola frondosa]|uniref:3,2-trans-enoyl-CoA isomerase n=1 Tax=Grifola frondosa TaxID=5627 RepID=A0A1C7MG33_GRIFR|nr:3,2-trans-enoyl-CoA isomerase [Grifola frondosa]
MSKVAVEISQGIATITFNRPETLNAITPEDYDAFASALWAIDKRDDVLVTVWQATGKWFCAGTSVTGTNVGPQSARDYFVNNVARANTDTTRALYSHSKILVAALNGPVMAFLGFFDLFTFSLKPSLQRTDFSSGIITESGSSVTFRNRMGAAKANEVLIFGKKKDAQELLECGFINKIFPAEPVPSFHAAVRTHLLAELEGLDPVALLHVKKLIKAGLNEQHNFDAVNLRESYARLSGSPLVFPQSGLAKSPGRSLDTSCDAKAWALKAVKCYRTGYLLVNLGYIP